MQWDPKRAGRHAGLLPVDKLFSHFKESKRPLWVEGLKELLYGESSRQQCIQLEGNVQSSTKSIT